MIKDTIPGLQKVIRAKNKRIYITLTDVLTFITIRQLVDYRDFKYYDTTDLKIIRTVFFSGSTMKVLTERELVLKTDTLTLIAMHVSDVVEERLRAETEN